MTVADATLYSSLASALDATTSQIQLTEQQMATGKSVSQPSDDPTAYAETELLTQQQSAITNDVALATQAQSQLTTINGALSQSANILNSAIQEATQGADGTISATQMSALGEAVNGLLTQLIGIGNTQYSGAYVFAGDQVLSTPYSTSGAYSGDSNTNSAILSNGTSLQLTFNGQAVFGDTTTGAIGALTALANALNTGNQSAVAATLPQLQTALQQIATAAGAVGMTMNSAAAETTNGNNELTTLAGAISDASQTDVAQAALTVNEQILQEQALVSLGSDLGRIPLINILA